ncbi:pantothenate synthetase [Micrococcales bacterium KH10]|nr:pantothenate synthetase [Micrococcales bacterium KH10]
MTQASKAGLPVVATTRDELGAALGALTGTRAVVMTMGALHRGHLELVRQAREVADHVVVTIFVNPLQFGPNEDFDRYPRTLEDDLAALGTDADLVFAPTVDQMYPHGKSAVTVSAGTLGTDYEGEIRPGHFDGVLTVVLKLLNLTQPDIAIFGQKDAQQFAVISAMVAALDVPVRLMAVPTVREEDGLALSSRNRYLSQEERAQARAIPQALTAAGRAADQGKNATQVTDVAKETILRSDGLVLDYVVLVEPETLEEVSDEYRGSALLLVAARAGSTRLIDNCSVTMTGQ